MSLKKKLAMAIVTTTAGAVIMAAGSFAYFSDGVTNATNTFAAARVSLSDVSNGTAWTHAAFLANLEPGDSDSFSTRVNNDGTVPEWIGIKNTISANTNDIFRDGGVTVSYEIVKEGASETILGSGTITSENNGVVINPVQLAVGDTALVTWTYDFDENAGNGFQGATGTLGTEIDAVQIRNNGTATAPAVWQ